MQTRHKRLHHFLIAVPNVVHEEALGLCGVIHNSIDRLDLIVRITLVLRLPRILHAHIHAPANVSTSWLMGLWGIPMQLPSAVIIAYLTDITIQDRHVSCRHMMTGR